PGRGALRRDLEPLPARPLPRLPWASPSPDGGAAGWGGGAPGGPPPLGAPRRPPPRGPPPPAPSRGAPRPPPPPPRGPHLALRRPARGALDRPHRRPGPGHHRPAGDSQAQAATSRGLPPCPGYEAGAAVLRRGPGTGGRLAEPPLVDRPARPARLRPGAGSQ